MPGSDSSFRRVRAGVRIHVLALVVVNVTFMLCLNCYSCRIRCKHWTHDCVGLMFKHRFAFVSNSGSSKTLFSYLVSHLKEKIYFHPMFVIIHVILLTASISILS